MESECISDRVLDAGDSNVFLITFCMPAMARLPAGSITVRVSLNPSRIAWQISSVLTVTWRGPNEGEV